MPVSLVGLPGASANFAASASDATYPSKPDRSQGRRLAAFGVMRSAAGQIV
jgi:hypothetical protein